MNKILSVLTLVFLSSVTLWAQGRGVGSVKPGGERIGPPVMNPGSIHSNAPAGPPSAATERNLGRQLAEQTGNGEKKGLKKSDSKPPETTPGSLHSNAPAGTPAAAAESQFGNNRAEDTGQGKKKGLEKQIGDSSQQEASSDKPEPGGSSKRTVNQ